MCLQGNDREIEGEIKLCFLSSPMSLGCSRLEIVQSGKLRAESARQRAGISGYLRGEEAGSRQDWNRDGRRTTISHVVPPS